jgi:hypothetical protein
MSYTKKVFVVFLMVAPSGVANAASGSCTQLVQNVQSLAANIVSAAPQYWAHRQNFVDYKFGKSRGVANAISLATTEQSLAAQLQGSFPNALANFQAAVATRLWNRPLPRRGTSTSISSLRPRRRRSKGCPLGTRSARSAFQSGPMKRLKCPPLRWRYCVK